LVEWVVMKGPKKYSMEDGKIDLWGKPRYKVLRKVTENSNPTMLHFYSSVLPLNFS
jgi:hypothetical protein